MGKLPTGEDGEGLSLEGVDLSLHGLSTNDVHDGNGILVGAVGIITDEGELGLAVSQSGASGRIEAVREDIRCEVADLDDVLEKIQILRKAQEPYGTLAGNGVDHASRPQRIEGMEESKRYTC